jgi:dynein heavy chain
MAGSGYSRSTGGLMPIASGGLDLPGRYKDILEQYLHELQSVKTLFQTYKDRPLLYKNFPPVAGAIAWARDLYLRAKKPILKFKKYGHGLLEDDIGERVRNQYLEFAR